MTQQKSNKLLIWSGAVILVAALAAFAAFDAHRRQGDVPQPSVKPDEPAVQPSEDQKNALKENALKGKPFTELYLASERLDHEGLSEDSTAIFRHILRADYSDAECLQDLTRRVNFKASSDLDDETKYAEIERLLDEALEARPNSWRVKTGVARLLDVLPNEGYMQDGKFVYTQPRLPAREDLLNCHERKRVRKLQLYADALPLVREELDQLGDAEEKTSDSSALFHENPSGYYLAFAGLFQNDVTLDFRRLLTLTDLSVLPDCQPVSEIRPVSIFDREDTRLNGAPVDEEGAPIFFTSPESFETAKNDGQRRQALLTELSERRPGYRATVCSQRARDAQALFGVQTLGWFAPGSSDAEQESRQKAIDDLKTLADNETIAKLENGVKRFELPPEYDYINLWREIAEIQGDSSSSALKEIALEYQNRRQLDKAADAWRRVLEQEDVPDHDLSQAKAALSQIVDSRVAIDSSSAVNGAKMDLNLRYRNAVGAEIVVKRLNVDEALKTVRNEEFWQEHGDILNMNSVVSTVLRRQYLPEENTENPELDALQKKLGELFNGASLVGEEAARYSVELEPDPNHYDKIKRVEFPVDEPGAYLVEITATGGKKDVAVVWLRDVVVEPVQTEIGAQLAGPVQVQNGRQYVARDARTGEPLVDQTIEFIVVNRRRDGDSFTVAATEYAKQTDETGSVSLANDEFDVYHASEVLIFVPKDGGDAVSAARCSFNDFQGIWRLLKGDDLLVKTHSFTFISPE